MVLEHEPCMAVMLRPIYTYTTKLGQSIDVEQGDGDVGGHVWDGALVLSRFLESHPHFVKGQSVLELGAGPGLVGFVCAALGASEVLLTDGFPHIVKRLETSVRRSGVSTHSAVSVQLVDWQDRGACLQGRTYDVVLGADVVYKRELVEPFLDTVEAASHGRTRVLVANGDRVSVRHFLAAATARGYVVEDVDFARFLGSGDHPAQRHRLWSLTKGSP